MSGVGVMTKNLVSDDAPEVGFRLMKECGFDFADFSLNTYLKNDDLYRSELNTFFDQSVAELERYFARMRSAAEKEGVKIHQMHMPYPIYVPKAEESVNEYLRHTAAVKSLYVCAFFNCKYMVVHGFKLARFLGSEEKEWQETESFLKELAPLAKELGIVICLENLYESLGRHKLEGPCCHAAKAAERIDRLNEEAGAEVFGFCFDTGHAKLTGLDFESFLTGVGSRLKVLHVHDNDGLSDLHQLPFSFTRFRTNRSTTDWEGFIRGLKNIRFDGVFSFETGPVLTAFPEELKPDVLKLISATGRYFMQKIGESRAE